MNDDSRGMPDLPDRTTIFGVLGFQRVCYRVVIPFASPPTPKAGAPAIRPCAAWVLIFGELGCVCYFAILFHTCGHSAPILD